MTFKNLKELLQELRMLKMQKRCSVGYLGVSYKEGFRKTIDWYFANKDKKAVKKSLKNS